VNRSVCWTVLLLVALCASARADAPAPTTQDYVSREEYERLKRDQESLRNELNALRRDRADTGAQVSPASQPTAEGPLDDLQRQLDELRDQVHRGLPGTEHFLLAGDASIGFASQRKNGSTFNATFSPLFLWEPTDRLLFEAAFDVSGTTDPNANSSTDVNLTIADVSYLMNDYLAVGGGVFIVPFGQYHNHFDPPWINKLPDDPLVFSDGGLAPNSQTGIFGRGAIPIGPTKLTYDAYVVNAPNLITRDPAAAGSLAFPAFTNQNGNFAIGGRLGFLPFPELEIGYSIEEGRVSPSNFADVHALLQAADAHYVKDVPFLSGRIDLRAEWVWSNVDRAIYDRRGTLGFGPLALTNYRDGGYLQASYRPLMVNNRILRNLEFVARYDRLRSPLRAPGGNHEQRWTIGVDYWLTPSAVLKAAYEFDQKKSGPDQNAFLVQLGLGL